MILHVWWQPCEKHKNCRLYSPLVKHEYGGRSIKGCYVHARTLHGIHPPDFRPLVKNHTR